MADIRIIKTGINVSKILKQLEQYPSDWGVQKEIEGAQQIDPDFHRIEAGVMQLVMGGISHPDEMVYNTEISIETPAYERHTEVCLLYTSPSPRDRQKSRMPSSA